MSFGNLIIGVLAQGGGGGGTPVASTYDLTVPASTVGEALFDFPVMVELQDMPSSFWSNVRSDGGNIRANGNAYVEMLAAKTLSDGSNDWGGYTGRVVIDANALQSIDGKVRLKIGADAGSTVEIGSMYLGAAASSGSYAFDGTPVAVTVNGASSFSLESDTDYYTDWLDLSHVGTDDLVLSFYVEAGASQNLRGKTTDADFSAYYVSGDDAATVAATGYSSGSRDVVALQSIDGYEADTDLPIDVTNIETGDGEGRMFFKTTLLPDEDNLFTISLLDEEETAPAVTDPLGRNAVWDGFEVVWVFPDVDNRTGKDAGDGHAQDMSDLEAAGVYKDFRKLTDVTAYGTLPRSDVWTVSASIRWAESSGDTQMVFLSVFNPDNTSTSYSASMLYDEGPDVFGEWRSSDSWNWSDVGFNYEEERRIAMANDGTVERAVYVSGYQENTDSSPTARPSGTGTDAGFALNGADGVNSQSGEAFYQYAWMRNEYMSTHWMDADAFNLENPTSFYFIEETGNAYDEPWALDSSAIDTQHRLEHRGLTLVNADDTNNLRQTVHTQNVLLADAGLVYWEVYMSGGDNTDGYVPVLNGDNVPVPSGDNPLDDGHVGRKGDGQLWAEGSSQVSGLLNFDIGDVVMIALDTSNGDIWTGVNGVWDDDPLSDPATYSPTTAPTKFRPGLQTRAPNARMTLRTSRNQQRYSAPAGATVPAEYELPQQVEVAAARAYVAVSSTGENMAVASARTYVIVEV